MLIGHVFQKQVFKNEAFALFIDTFLEKNMGVVKGCGLSNTNNTVTISDGYFVIQGRFLEIFNGETVTVDTNGYYSLVCEIDLSQENTNEQLNQASIKAIKGASAYPTLIKQDLNDGGTLYQYEFARFRKTDNGITDFTDRRTFLDFDSIYSEITARFGDLYETQEELLQSLITQLETELSGVEDRSGLFLTSNLNKITGGITLELNNEGNYEGYKEISYPEFFNRSNSSIVSIRTVNTVSASYMPMMTQYSLSNSDSDYSNGYCETAVVFFDDKIHISFLSKGNAGASTINIGYEILLIRV